MSLEQQILQDVRGIRNKRFIYTAGSNVAIGSNNFRTYWSPNGRIGSTPRFNRQLQLGILGRAIKISANIPINTKGIFAVITMGISTNTIDSPALLTIPAGITGQFTTDLGVTAIRAKIPISKTLRYGTWLDVRFGGGGFISMERSVITVEVEP